MAKAYYPSGNAFKEWTANMVNAAASYETPSFNNSIYHLGYYTYVNTTSGEGPTLLCTYAGGYNGNITQQLVTLLTFRFGNGSGTLYNGWAMDFPATLTTVNYYYQYGSNKVNIYCDNKSYSGTYQGYTVISGSERWTDVNKTVSALPSGAVAFRDLALMSSYDAPVIVSSSQPSNTNATLWIQP